MLNLKILLAIMSLWIIWGSTFLATKIAIDTIPPLFMAGFCFFIAGIVLFCGSWYAIFRSSNHNVFHQRNYRHGSNSHNDLKHVDNNVNDSNWKANALLSRHQWKIASITGITLLLGGQGGITWGEQYVSSSMAALLFSSASLWMAFIGYIIFGERLQKKTILGLIVGLGGLILLIGPIPYITIKSSAVVSYVGILSLTIASISWAFGSIYLHRSSTTKKNKESINEKIRTNPPWYNQLLLTGVGMLIGGLLLIIAGVVSGEYSSLNILKISSQSLIALVYMIGIGAIAGFTIFIWLLKNTSAFLANTFTYTSPVIAVFLGWVIGEEIVIARIIPATAMILGSVALIVISSNISTTITDSSGDAKSTSSNFNSINKK